MKKIEIHTTLQVFQDVTELDQQVQDLMNYAVKARHKAYAPYSNFSVGCAILLENGHVVTGNNQENAAYPSGLCAERVAIYAAGANHPKVPVKIMAITASPVDDSLVKPVAPCGSCRQAVAEYENLQDEPIAIYFMGAAGQVVKAASIKDLLPLLFDQSYL